MTTVAASINGQNVACYGFHVVSGSYGSVGHGELHTSRAWLTAAGIDLYSLAASAPSPLVVNIYVDGVQLFGGELVDIAWDYDRDDVEVHFRDWAGPLVDQKRILSNLVQPLTALTAPLTPGQEQTLNVSTENQTLSNIVTPIAKTFGLTPVFNFETTTNGNPVYGTTGSGSQTAWVSAPQSLWGILMQLARDTGYELYVTPQKQLVLGIPGAGLPTLNFSYNQPPGAAGIPCRSLHARFNPRRNSTFRVLVLSYDNNTAQTVTGRATVIGPGFAGLNSTLAAKGIQTSGVGPGIYSGANAVSADSALVGASEAGISPQVQLYTFHIDGLTATQAQQRATAIAADIQRREVLIEAEIDGYAAMLPTQKFQIAGDVDPSLTGRVFYIHAYQHMFRMDRNSKTEGFLTRIRGLVNPLGDML